MLDVATKQYLADLRGRQRVVDEFPDDLVDKLVTHYRCSACSRPYPLYQGEYPVTFWVLVAAELATKFAKGVYLVLRHPRAHLRRLVSRFEEQQTLSFE